jgi:hypothetical protein
VPQHPNPNLVFLGSFKCLPLAGYGFSVGNFTCAAETDADKRKVTCKCDGLGTIIVVPVYSASESAGATSTTAYVTTSSQGPTTTSSNQIPDTSSTGLSTTPQNTKFITTSAPPLVEMTTPAPVTPTPVKPAPVTPAPVKAPVISFEMIDGVGQPEVGYQGYVIIKMTAANGKPEH